MGCEVVKVYKDHGISGAKAQIDERPAFDALCRAAAQRQFDVVMAWSVDRLGRSLKDLVGFLSELHALKIDLFLHQQGLDTTTPSGKAMFGIRCRCKRSRSGVPEHLFIGCGGGKPKRDSRGRYRGMHEPRRIRMGSSFAASLGRHGAAFPLQPL
jgi:hypothetical protein